MINTRCIGWIDTMLLPLQAPLWLLFRGAEERMQCVCCDGEARQAVSRVMRGTLCCGGTDVSRSCRERAERIPQYSPFCRPAAGHQNCSFSVTHCALHTDTLTDGHTVSVCQCVCV
eukprot:gene12044-biopygen8783